MTPAEIEKEAERLRLLAKSYIGECDHLPHGICKNCFVNALRAVHDAAIEEAGRIADTWKWGGAMAKQIRAFKLSSEAGGNG